MASPATPNMNRLYPVVRLLGALFSLTLLAAVAGATVRFDIPIQPAASALQLFGQQARVEVVYPAAELRKVQAAEVKGEMDPATAIKQLLAGTGYFARQLGATNFAVAKIQPGAVEGEVREEKTGRPVIGAKVQLADSGRSATTDKRGRFILENIIPGSQLLLITAEGMQNTKVTDVEVSPGHRLSLSPIGIPVQQGGPLQLEPFTVSAKKNDGVVELDPYAVTGTKQKPFEGTNVDIPRTINDPQAYYILDSKAIDQSGATNVEDFLKQRLTMNTNVLSNSQATVSGSGNALSANQNASNISAVNLRGLGVNNTLILINGKKISGTPVTGSLGAISGRRPGQFDLNGIPLGAIDRIEVLPASASGIYGANALGGVVNIVMKNKFNGGEIRLNYENTFSSDAPIRSLAVSYGRGSKGGRTQIMMSARVEDALPLQLQDRREFVDRGLKAILTNLPVFLNSTTFPFRGASTNIQGLPVTVAGVTTFTPLVLKGGIPLNASITHIPDGITSTTPVTALNAALLANAGSWDLNLPRTSATPIGLLLPLAVNSRVKSAVFSVRQKVFADTEITGDIFYGENRAVNRITPLGSPGQITVPTAAATNPFTASVRVSAPYDITSPNTNVSESASASVGFVSKLPKEWTLQGDFTWSRNRVQNDYSQMDTTAMAADILSGALNPFVDPFAAHPNLRQYLTPTHQELESDVRDYAIRGSGPLLEILERKPSLTAGIEHREQRRPSSISTITYPISTLESNYTEIFADKQETNSGYGELSIPLWNGARRAWVEEIVLQLAGRWDWADVNSGTVGKTVNYNLTPSDVTFYGATLNNAPLKSRTDYAAHNYTTALKYKVSPWLTLRGSYSTAFTPPPPEQLVPNPLPDASLSSVTDPKNGNAAVQVQTQSGGNPGLRPQSSKNWNAGFIFEPQFPALRGTRIGAEFYKIQQFDAISTLSPQLLVNNETLFGDRITRNASGTIVLVNTSALNLFKLETEGIDLSASFGRLTSLGSINCSLLGSIMLHAKTQYSLTLPSYDAVGFPAEGGATKVKGNGVLSWAKGPYGVGLVVRYYSSYKQQGAAGSPNSQRLANGAVFGQQVLAQGSDTIPSQHYEDVSFTYTAKNGAPLPLVGGMLKDMTIRLGVKNVLNRKGPLDVSYPYYSSPYADLRLRSYWIGLTREF